MNNTADTRMLVLRQPLRTIAFAVSAVVVLLGFTLILGAANAYAAPCDPPVLNPIVCENSLPGAPASQWDVSGSGSTNIQGFAADISVDQGGTVQFKVNTPAIMYRLDIYRMGYYAGNGARLVATVQPSAPLPQVQPNCLTTPATGLVDCGNWNVSASWQVPTTAVSGIYFAKLVRTDGTTGTSHVPFIVRDDDGASDVLFQTSDTTWQAYNRYGGNSLYTGSPDGRAYKVSYNRPFTTRGYAPEDWMFNAEYPMVRWLERNGYNTSYTTGVDSDRRGAEIREHKVFLSVGHDEYWSGGQRANVESARDAGVNLAFLSGNEIFWKTRWENSTAGTSTPYRTLVSYKETHAGSKIDPETNVWTGTWRDPRFSPPADGGRPENALSGQLFMVNDSAATAIQVPAADGKMRLWRNTSVATLASGQTAALAAETLGYEWDVDSDNGSRPAGSFRLSSTTVNNAPVLTDYGSTYVTDTATHNMTLYRAGSGALVFGAGTVQWAWGLDANHDRGSAAADVRMQQATVNMLADMGGVQPGTIQSGVTAATASTDVTKPTSVISTPANGSSAAPGETITVTGTAADTGGGVVGGVEVSMDGGATWHPATGRQSWSYTGALTPSGGQATIRSRATDDSGNTETPSGGTVINVSGAQACPCSLWPDSTTPANTAETSDSSAVELGLKFRASVSGQITGIRFYKGTTNTGTHVGRLWTSSGALLATVTFTGETSQGWQKANFSTPVNITAGTTYVASYHAPNGNYAFNLGYFTSADFTTGPLTGLSAGSSGGNGVYAYGPSGSFPSSTYQSTNYWVDVVFATSPSGSDTTAPTVDIVTPANAATGVAISTSVTAQFSESLTASTVTSSTFELRDASNQVVPSAVSYDGTASKATLTPTNSLAYSSTYTATVKGGASGVKDSAGNALASDKQWSFTTGAASSCPCSLWSDSTTPQITANTGDSGAVELGVKFRSATSGQIAGIRFYKGTTNTGTHVGRLWTTGGTLLATVTFTGETSQGWQKANFSSPVNITAGTTYVASYHAPNGNYAYDPGYFTTSEFTNQPLTALSTAGGGGNGVYAYGPSGSFPASSFQAANYWVDVIFSSGSSGSDTTPPTVESTTPADGVTGVSVNSTISAQFSEGLTASTVNSSTFVLRDASNQVVPSTVSYDGTTSKVSLVPTNPLSYSTGYSVTLVGGSSGIKDSSGNALATNKQWAFTTQAESAVDNGPGGPIAVVTTAANPYGRFYGEILRAEGLNEFKIVDVSTMTAATLAQYEVVILAEQALNSTQVATLNTWTNSGGRLIAMRPDKQLAPLLGITDGGATLSNSYLQVDTSSAPGAGIVGTTIQFHGTADRYGLSGARAVATLYSTSTTSTANPAVTLRTSGLAGGGKAAAFTYDLARSIVATRQGNIAWAGQDRDGASPVRSNDLFFGAAAGDIKPDWVDLSKVAIPQADEQQRLLANLITDMLADKMPLPRFWYFPRGEKAVVLMTGDDHGNNGTAGRFDRYEALSSPSCSVAAWECVRSSSYVYPSTPITNTQAKSYSDKGFEIGVHVTTGCANWTKASLTEFYASQIAAWKGSFPSLPPAVSTRIHCIAWSDWTGAPEVELAQGIRLDTNYYYWPGDWVKNAPGFFTGSGMPMRFADETGAMIDVYQAATQMTDESGQAYPFTPNTLLDRAIGPEGYYGVFTANMHTDVANIPESDAIVSSALARSVPVVSGRQLLEWTDGRNASSFTGMAWNGTTLSFGISQAAGANGLIGMVPLKNGSNEVNTITRSGASVSFTTEKIKGVDYANFSGLSGSYVVTYGQPAGDTTPPVITGISGTADIDGTATVTWTTNEPSTSQVQYGTSASALTQNKTDSTLTTNHTVTLTGLNPATTYYYRVSSTDAAGNQATSTSTGSFGTAVHRVPASVTIQAGSLNGGSSGSLATDDNTYYSVNSITSGVRNVAWYGTMSSVPNSAKKIAATYAGLNTQSCVQVFAIYNWTTSSWTTLDSRTVGTTEVKISNLSPSGSMADFVSGTTGNGNVRLRITCTGSATNFISRGDFMDVTYTP